MQLYSARQDTDAVFVGEEKGGQGGTEREEKDKDAESGEEEEDKEYQSIIN